MTMSTPQLVKAFYEDIWNAGRLDVADELLSEDFLFRGSLDSERRGRAEFLDYVRSIRDALSNYRCEALECVAESDKAFAKMRFSGVHTAEFRGYSPTMLPIHWLGAALFRFEEDAIAELWVLGDLAGLDALLQKNCDGKRYVKELF
jgi:predicted ester cyclase